MIQRLSRLAAGGFIFAGMALLAPGPLDGLRAQDSDPADTPSESQEPAPDDAGLSGRTVWMITIDGAIGPAAASYVGTNIKAAAAAGAEALILRMDTPGGLDDSMRDIDQDILAAAVPVIAYVAPPGARAASAGTYILYASHLAAMAPGTNLGAATPVQLGGAPGEPETPRPPGSPDSPGTDQPDDEESGTGDVSGPDSATSNEQAMRNKVVNDAVATIRSLAELRGRNADWAERAVREGISATASEALELGVIELIAATPTELLTAADGREVTMEGGVTHVMATAGASLNIVEMTWTQKVLSIITNPNIAFLLLNIGAVALLAAFYTGEPITGIVGIACLVVGFSALSVLPVNWAGVALVALGLLLLVMEAFVTSHGLLTVAGVVCFVLGGVYLIDSPIPELRLDWRLIGGLAVAMGIAVFAVLSYGLAAQTRKVVSGGEQLIGMHGKVLQWEGNTGYVLVDGERWRARSKEPLSVGQEIEVTAMDGLVLVVKPRRGRS